MVAKNEIRHLRRSFPVILRQSLDVPYEVIVIDSGSTDGSVEFVRKHASIDSRLRLIQIEPEAFHHARTRNLGADLARGRYLVFLGGDAVPLDTGWLKALMQPIISADDPLVVASYGRQVPRANARPETVCRLTYNYGREALIKGRELGDSPRDRYFFSSVNCCIDLERVRRPLFDSAFPVAEDISLSKGIIDSGLRIAYQPLASVEHSHNYGRLDILRRYFDHGVVYQQMGIWSRRDSSIGGDGRRYLILSLRSLQRDDHRSLVQFAVYFAFSAIGLQLGMHQRRLPRRIRRALTVYGTCD